MIGILSNFILFMKIALQLGGHICSHSYSERCFENHLNSDDIIIEAFASFVKFIWEVVCGQLWMQRQYPNVLSILYYFP